MQYSGQHIGRMSERDMIEAAHWRYCESIIEQDLPQAIREHFYPIGTPKHVRIYLSKPDRTASRAIRKIEISTLPA
jgi:hypothetical protein